MVYCKDCKYSVISRTPIGMRYKECRHPEALVFVNTVDGNHSYAHCKTMRSEGNPCGPEGKLFKKKSILQKLLS